MTEKTGKDKLILLFNQLVSIRPTRFHLFFICLNAPFPYKLNTF